MAARREWLGALLAVATLALGCQPQGDRPAKAEDALGEAGEVVRLPFVEDHEGGRFGYVDRTGRIVIPPTFAYAQPFEDGHALVVEPGGDQAIVDPSGKRVGAVPRCPEEFGCYPDLQEVSQGRIMFGQPGGCTDGGYMDMNGKVVIKPRFKIATRFSEGLAWVANDKFPDAPHDWRWFCIDRSGGRKFPVHFRQVCPFAEGFAAVQNEAKRWCHVDTESKVLADQFWDNADKFSEGLAFVCGGGFRGYIDRTGRRVIALPAGAGRGEPFSNGLALFEIRGGSDGPTKSGYIDRSGKVVVGPVFGYGHGFSEGLAFFTTTNSDGEDVKKGFIDATGRYRIELPACNLTADFRNGLCAVELHEGGTEKIVYIDRVGQIAIRPPAGCRFYVMFPGRD